MDVYVEHRSVDIFRAWLMDVEPFADSTDALLFCWAEINFIGNGTM
jgi:hypothetical protein